MFYLALTNARFANCLLTQLIAAANQTEQTQGISLCASDYRVGRFNNTLLKSISRGTYVTDISTIARASVNINVNR
jgi:hypothetical protein